MNTLQKKLGTVLLTLAVVTSCALAQNQAQRPPPHLGFVYPADGAMRRSGALAEIIASVEAV